MDAALELFFSRNGPTVRTRKAVLKQTLIADDTPIDYTSKPSVWHHIFRREGNAPVHIAIRRKMACITTMVDVVAAKCPAEDTDKVATSAMDAFMETVAANHAYMIEDVMCSDFITKVAGMTRSADVIDVDRFTTSVCNLLETASPRFRCKSAIFAVNAIAAMPYMVIVDKVACSLVAIGCKDVRIFPSMIETHMPKLKATCDYLHRVFMPVFTPLTDGGLGWLLCVLYGKKPEAVGPVLTEVFTREIATYGWCNTKRAVLRTVMVKYNNLTSANIVAVLRVLLCANLKCSQHDYVDRVIFNSDTTELITVDDFPRRRHGDARYRSLMSMISDLMIQAGPSLVDLLTVIAYDDSIAYRINKEFLWYFKSESLRHVLVHVLDENFADGLSYDASPHEIIMSVVRNCSNETGHVTPHTSDRYTLAAFAMLLIHMFANYTPIDTIKELLPSLFPHSQTFVVAVGEFVSDLERFVESYYMGVSFVDVSKFRALYKAEEDARTTIEAEFFNVKSVDSAKVPWQCPVCIENVMVVFECAEMFPLPNQSISITKCCGNVMHTDCLTSMIVNDATGKTRCCMCRTPLGVSGAILYKTLGAVSIDSEIAGIVKITSVVRMLAKPSAMTATTALQI